MLYVLYSILELIWPQSKLEQTQSAEPLCYQGSSKKRRVECYADQAEFQVRFMTDELGTESENPADPVFDSSAITGEQAALPA